MRFSFQVASNPLVAAILLSSISWSLADKCIPAGGWSFRLDTNYKINSDAKQASDIQCTYDTLLDAFTTQIFDANMILKSADCNNTAEVEFNQQIGVEDREEGITKVYDMCSEVQAKTRQVSFDDITYIEGPQFIKMFYSGGENWNEETETLLYPSDGESAVQVLKQDSKMVKIYYEYSKAAQFQMPDLEQFDPSVCASHAAQCCWPRDRQAGDNNGNCASPYDEKCIDKDVADNTDLCYVDLEKASYSNGVDAEGFSIFPNGNKAGEGPIHCHGFAWSTDESEVSARYKANNLFYVSMYDHMYTRGYVENIPGSPMCGCVEHMPVVSRSDCTQTNVKESYTFNKVGDDDTLSGYIKSVTLNYQACQGAGNQDNDLSAFVQQLVNDGKLSTTEQNIFKTRVVGNNQCSNAVNDLLSEKNFTKGFNIDSTKWTYVVGENFPDEEPILDARLFKDMVQSQGDVQIVRRVCPTCSVSHKDIYYRRLTSMPDDFDLLDTLMNNWFDTNNEFNVDFALYSSYMDAYYDQNRWAFCNFNDPGIGFPRDCGPEEKTTFNWNSYYRGGGKANHHAFLLPANPEFEPSIVNLALGKPTIQSSAKYGGFSYLAVDGTTVGIGTQDKFKSTTRTDSQVSPWWQVNLEYETLVKKVYLWNRVECCGERLSDVNIEVIDLLTNTVVASKTIIGEAGVLSVVEFDDYGHGIRISLPSNATDENILSLAEVQVDGIQGSPLPLNIRVDYFEADNWRYLPNAGLSKGRTPYKTDYISEVHFPKSYGLFASSERKENVAALLQGYLDFGSIDGVEICLTSDNGSKLYIDDEVLIAQEDTCNTVSVTSVHKVTIEYFQKLAESELTLKWKLPGSSTFELIPSGLWSNQPPPTASPSASPTLSAAPSSVKAVIYPTSDTYVRSGIYKTQNYEQEPNIAVKHDVGDYNRFGLLEFDMRSSRAIDCRAFLNIFISNVGASLNSRTVTVKRLLSKDMDLDSISYDLFSPEVDETGPSFEVKPSDKYTWLRIEISDIVQPSDLILMLEVTSEKHSSSHFSINSLETDKPPYIEVYPITEAPTPAPTISSAPSSVKSIIYANADAHIRAGSYKSTNFGSEDRIVLKQDSNPSYDRIGLLEFDTSTAKVTDSRAFLNIYVAHVNDDLSSRSVRINRLSPTVWDETTVTYENFEMDIDKVGPSFDVHKSDAGSWLRIEMTDLLQSDELLLMLEVTTEHAKSYFYISSHESDNAPFIEVLPITASPTMAPTVSSAPSSVETILYPTADAYIRAGSFGSTNYADENRLVIKNDSTLKYKRYGLMQYETSAVKVSGKKAFLNVFISQTSSGDPSRTVTVKRLAPTDWDENTVTYNNFDMVVDQVGPSFVVNRSDQGSWLRVEITDLMVPKDDLLLMLEITSAPSSSSHFSISSKEQTANAPYIELEA